MLLAKFRSSDPVRSKRIAPNEIVSAKANDCPHEHIPDFEALVKGAQRKRKMYVKDQIVARSPLVRMFFRTTEGHEHTPIITGHLVKARVIEADDMNDMFEITVRINAEQAANLPFLEVYDA
jgi:hypothetical protein